MGAGYWNACVSLPGMVSEAISRSLDLEVKKHEPSLLLELTTLYLALLMSTQFRSTDVLFADSIIDLEIINANLITPT